MEGIDRFAKGQQEPGPFPAAAAVQPPDPLAEVRKALIALDEVKNLLIERHCYEDAVKIRDAAAALQKQCGVTMSELLDAVSTDKPKLGEPSKATRELTVVVPALKFGLMVTALDRLRERGIHADCHPTSLHRWKTERWFRYLETADRVVRMIARQGLGEDVPEPGPSLESFLMSDEEIATSKLPPATGTDEIKEIAKRVDKRPRLKPADIVVHPDGWANEEKGIPEEPIIERGRLVNEDGHPIDEGERKPVNHSITGTIDVTPGSGKTITELDEAADYARAELGMSEADAKEFALRIQETKGHEAIENGHHRNLVEKWIKARKESTEEE